MTRPTVNVNVGRKSESSTTPKNLIQLTEEVDQIKDSIDRNGSMRPELTANDKGYQFYDTILNIPVWWTGTGWVDANGSPAPSPVVPADDEPDESEEEQ